MSKEIQKSNNPEIESENEHLDKNTDDQSQQPLIKATTDYKSKCATKEPHHCCLLDYDEDFQAQLASGNEAFRKLGIVVAICFLFMIVEIAGGIISNSLAILTDAAHMLSDVGGMGISMISIYIGQKNATAKNSFGYHRAEVLGALVSIIIIWGMVVWLSWEATTRMFFLDDIKIDAPIMLGTAFISLACNIFNLIILGHMPLPCIESSGGNFMDSVTSVYKPHGGHECGGHGDEEEGGDHSGHNHGPGEGHEGHDHGAGGHSHENLNISAAVVHVIGDMLQSVGVILASILIYIFGPSWSIADPICTYLFSIIVMQTTIPTYRECMRILMEVQPKGCDNQKLREQIEAMDGVQEVSDLHTFALAGQKNVLSVHITMKDSGDIEKARVIHEEVLKLCKKNQLCHATTQIL